jgi:hypothetical protein
MARPLPLLVVSALALSTAASHAPAQSFNVDLGPNILFAPAPSQGYGAAAAQFGVWNAFQPTFTARVLNDLTGAPTSVTLRSDSVSSFTVFPTVMPAGEDQRLMEDFQITPNLNTLVTWTFEGLASGDYDLYVYASDPTNASLQMTIGAPGHTPQVVGAGWPGQHAFGQTYALFRVSPTNGVLTFDATVVGNQFASGIVNGLQLVEVVTPSLGTTYCTSNSNSTGAAGTVFVSGSLTAAADDLRLEARALPAGTFAYFLTSRTAGQVMNPAGSQGVLCLGGSVGRFNQLVGQADAAGTYTICTQGCAPQRTFSLNQIPQPTGAVAVAAGETWRFQCWFRDSQPGGPPTSNFTHARQLTFQ